MALELELFSPPLIQSALYVVLLTSYDVGVPLKFEFDVLPSGKHQTFLFEEMLLS
jgi:hypothetical protein